MIRGMIDIIYKLVNIINMIKYIDICNYII